MKYTFKRVEHCNMCGETAQTAKVLGKRMNQSQGIRPTKKLGITTTVVMCKKCDLVYANPLPVPESLEQHYSTPPEDYWKPEYFKIEGDYFKHQIKTFFNLFGENHSLTALDIGAGVGKCMTALSRAGFEVYGIEPSEPFYRRAIKELKIDESRLRLCTVEEARFEENLFDFITFGAVLEHLYDPSGSIIKALGWLKPGGLIQIEVPSSAWLTNKIFNLLYRLQGLDYVGNISPMHSPFHLYEFGIKSFQEHARQNGYEIAHHRYHVCETYLPAVLNPIVRPLMAKTDRGMQLEVWLRKPASNT